MNENFKTFIDSLIEYSKSRQEQEPENVGYEQALKCCYYITHIQPRQIGDLLLYCSSLSSLNRYVKQEDSKFSKMYQFKSNGLFRLMNQLSHNPKIEGFQMKFDRDESKGNSTLLYTSVYGMHFSFHSVSKSLQDMIPNFYLGEFEWDGIKKQVCASSLFSAIDQNDLLVSCIGYRTSDIKKSADDFAAKAIFESWSKSRILHECDFYAYCQKKKRKSNSAKRDSISELRV